MRIKNPEHCKCARTCVCVCLSVCLSLSTGLFRPEKTQFEGNYPEVCRSPLGSSASRKPPRGRPGRTDERQGWAQKPEASTGTGRGRGDTSPKLGKALACLTSPKSRAREEHLVSKTNRTPEQSPGRFTDVQDYTVPTEANPASGIRTRADTEAGVT